MDYLKAFDTIEERDAFKETIPANTPAVLLVRPSDVEYYARWVINGVFIQHINGTLYTTEEWMAGGFTNDQANGVAVGDNEHDFVISKTLASTSIQWGGQGTQIEGIMTASSSSDAKTDFKGEKNTDAIIAALGGNEGTPYAAKVAKEYMFPNGKRGYLPAMGELVMILRYKSAINAALEAIGGEQILYSGSDWSSTQATSNNSFYMFWQNSATTSAIKNNKYRVRAFCSVQS